MNWTLTGKQKEGEERKENYKIQIGCGVLGYASRYGSFRVAYRALELFDEYMRVSATGSV
jgi:hypothetical protein